MLTGIAVVAAAQAAFTYLPPLQVVFDARPVALGDGLAIIAVGAALLVIVELEKWLAGLLGVGAPGAERESEGEVA